MELGYQCPPRTSTFSHLSPLRCSSRGASQYLHYIAFDGIIRHMIVCVVMANWIDIEQAAKYLSLGVRNLYSLAQQGRIPANRVGKGWRFDQKELDSWVR